jgi:hypothetical protein
MVIGVNKDTQYNAISLKKIKPKKKKLSAKIDKDYGKRGRVLFTYILGTSSFTDPCSTSNAHVLYFPSLTSVHGSIPLDFKRARIFLSRKSWQYLHVVRLLQPPMPSAYRYSKILESQISLEVLGYPLRDTERGASL